MKNRVMAWALRRLMGWAEWVSWKADKVSDWADAYLQDLEPRKAGPEESGYIVDVWNHQALTVAEHQRVFADLMTFAENTHGTAIHLPPRQRGQKE